MDWKDIITNANLNGIQACSVEVLAKIKFKNFYTIGLVQPSQTPKIGKGSKCV